MRRRASFIKPTKHQAALDRAAEPVFWSEPAAGLWVGQTPDAFLGMVDRVAEGYTASNAMGKDLGIFATPSLAQLAVYRAYVSPVRERWEHLTHRLRVATTPAA